MGGGKDGGGTREGEESGLARPWGLLEHTMLHLPIKQGLLEHRRQAIVLITHRVQSHKQVIVHTAWIHWKERSITFQGEQK